MRSDIMAAQMSTKNITFSRAQTGWLFREDKTVSCLNELLCYYCLEYYLALMMVYDCSIFIKILS